MAMEIRLEAFQGPLDLLLHLIEKNKVDIYDIPISRIADQYMEALQNSSLDMEALSEFLLLGATLLDIKCRMLLPREEQEAREEEDPRAALVEKLLEYKMVKFLSMQLAEQKEAAGLPFCKGASIPQELRDYRPPLDYAALLEGVDLAALQRVFGELARRQKARMDPIRSGYGDIQREEVDLEGILSHVAAFAGRHGAFGFEELLPEDYSRMELIVTFLAVLEMMKEGRLSIEQDGVGGRIWIRAAIS